MPAEEKTEQATPKRKQDERKKGNVFMSQEVITVASFLAVFFTLSALGGIIMGMLTGGIERFWSEAAVRTTYTPGDVRTTFIQCAGIYAVGALPSLLMAGLIAIILTFAQTRGLVTMSSAAPKFNRLSPAKGIKKVFSMRGLMELMKAILKIVILGYVIYNTYIGRMGELPRLMEMDFASVLSYGAAFVTQVVTNTGVIFAFLAAADYMFQRWQYEKDLRMTKQEIKEEYKQTEGDPQIKGKIREKQRQMAQARMMSNVPKADVIVRNPTHYAVAIQYDADKNRSPMVLAKGVDLVALRIVKVAEENGIMTVENKPLARGLYDTVPLDREIPEDFFGPVAEVLAFVYSKQKKNPLGKKGKK